MIQNCQYYWAPSVSENLSYFIAVFLWATVVNLSKWGERIAKRLKDQVRENFYKMNCSRAQFPNYVLRPINKCKIFYFSAAWHTLKPILLFFELHSSVDQINLALLDYFVWMYMPGYSASVDRSAVKSWFKGDTASLWSTKLRISNIAIFATIVLWYFLILNMFTTKVGGEFKWSSRRSSLLSARATTVLNLPARLKFLAAPGKQATFNVEHSEMSERSPLSC